MRKMILGSVLLVPGALTAGWGCGPSPYAAGSRSEAERKPDAGSKAVKKIEDMIKKMPPSESQQHGRPPRRGR